MDLNCDECDVISLYLYVALLMDMFVLCVACFTVFVNCLVKQIAICLDVVVILLCNVISSFKCLRTGSQVFALILLFLCVILHTMWSGKSLQ